MYIHQRQNWPEFNWDDAEILPLLANVRYRQGRLLGEMAALGFKLREEASLQTLTADVLKSSEIEGEMLDHDQVRSSIARRLGMDIGGLVPADRNVEGVVEMMLDATQRYEKPLTAERLFGWQASLFPTGWSGMHRVEVGGWRTDKDGPMQVISGAMGPETVHFQAPSVALLHAKMDAFITWFNNAHTIDPVLKAAIAHLWFVTIHPFDDGNGRVARALMDMQLARAEESQQRFYSMSAQIRQERKDYYKILESTQRDTLDITEWLTWFLQCLERAIAATDQTLSVVKMKARFWALPGAEQVSERQKLMLNKLLEGFKGKLTSSKWALMTKTSQDTAVRDIQDLIDRGLLLKEDAGGRSTSYVLNLPG